MFLVPFRIAFILSVVLVVNVSSWSLKFEIASDKPKPKNESCFPKYMMGASRAKIAEFPYQAVLLEDDNFLGSAVIVDKNWALTSAQNLLASNSFSRPDSQGNNYLRVGTSFPYYGGTKYYIDFFLLHPNFTGSWDSDLALLHLPQDIDWTCAVNPIKIGTSLPEEFDNLKVTGWGGVDILQLAEVDLPLLLSEDCQWQYINDYHFTNFSFCTAELNAGPCEMDRGGPAVYNDKLLGIFSGTESCGSIVLPAIYTDLTKFTDWIQGVVGDGPFQDDDDEDPVNELKLKCLNLPCVIQNSYKVEKWGEPRHFVSDDLSTEMDEILRKASAKYRKIFN